MFDNDPILELDYSTKTKLSSSLSNILLKSFSVLFLILFSSYQNPNINNTYIKYSFDELQNHLMNNVNSINDFNNSDTSQNIKVRLNKLVIEFFENRDYQPAWTSNYNTNLQFKNYINLLDSAKYYGFPLDYFDSEKIKLLNSEFINSKELNTRINLELSATYSALKLMLFLNRGIIEKDTSTTYNEFIETLPEVLNNALNQNNLRNEILSVQPDLVQLKSILNSLPNFIDLQLSIKYTTPKFIDDNLLAKGLYYAGITEASEIDSSANNSAAIYKLQEQYNLPKDSNLNAPTHLALVSLLQYRYFQTCLNLHRLRNLQNSSENYLFVNIPEYKLHVIESKQKRDVFNVIVGKEDTPTPILSSDIEKVVMNPYWTVPKSIVDNEMIKKIRSDSTYLEKHGFYIINSREETVDKSVIKWNSSDPLGTKYYIRQTNSSSNALGQVKFFFPNEQSVYLHDTPSKGLFKQNRRSLSHGCIRLENPDKLAQYLTDKYHSENAFNIKKLISTNKNNEINLVQKVKIHIQYITCSGKENSDLEFYNDIYNLDKSEIRAVFSDQIQL